MQSSHILGNIRPHALAGRGVSLFPDPPRLNVTAMRTNHRGPRLGRLAVLLWACFAWIPIIARPALADFAPAADGVITQKQFDAFMAVETKRSALVDELAKAVEDKGAD